ncbi:MAG: flagellar hook-basal body protein [Lachnospiraceae bacterium]|nr:flagellar hook-basal body protein [Lachnospiraceae bacterium]
MRVTNAPMYRKYTTAVNDVHSKLNKAMNKISSGAAYEAAADNPLAYYQGKKMDHQYLDVEAKLQLMTDIQNRIHQQELGARTVQTTLSDAKNTELLYVLNGTNNVDPTTVDTKRSALIQKQQSAINALNAQYEGFYIYGGNDLSCAPFSMNADGTSLTFKHTFPGDSQPTTIVLDMKKNGDQYGFEVNTTSSLDKNGQPLSSDDALDLIRKSMTERGYVDIGYGTIDDKTTLLDTFTGGFNVMTGVNVDKAASLTNNELLEALNNSSVGLMGQAIAATDTYLDDEDLTAYRSYLNQLSDKMTVTAHNISTIYSDLGNKYSLIDDTETRLKDVKYGLIEEYKDKLGADPYESIMEMFSYQYSYTASLQLSSKLMESSLFNFIS